MSAQLLSSKIVIVEEEPRVRGVPALPTAIVGCIGLTERGPIGQPTLVTSFDEYVAIFGGFTTTSDVATSALGFFLNGGEQMWVVRTVHYTDVNTPATQTGVKGTVGLDSAVTAPTFGQVTGSIAEPFVLSPNDDLQITVDGVGPTASVFAAAAAVITAGTPETYALVDGQTLTFKIDGGSVQTVTFNTAEFANILLATAQEVANVINAEATGLSADDNSGSPRITSDKKGTGSSVEVTGGTANGALGFSLTPVTGTGDVADIEAVTVAEIKTVVENDVSGLTVNSVAGKVQIVTNLSGPTKSIQVDASSLADDKMGLDNATHSGTTGAATGVATVNGKTEGAYANSLRVQVADATSGDADQFNLAVLDDGVVVEIFPNLGLIDGEDNYFETVVNDTATGSDLIALVDIGPVLRPANGIIGPLTTGNDGLVGLADADYIGSDVGDTGLYALDIVTNVTLLIVPGVATAGVHNAMITYTETHRNGRMFAIMDPPAGETAPEMVTYVESTAAILELSEFAAIYWPRVKIINPDKTVYGNVNQITVPPSGFIAGVYARTDSSQPGGVYQPPAGTERGVLFGVVGFEDDPNGNPEHEVVDERKRDIVFPKRINPITTFEGTPRHIDGSRTLKGGGNFPYVAERRGVIFIENTLRVGLLFAKHSNNTPGLRARVRRTITSFLVTQMNNDAFRSRDPATAFFVDVSGGVNPTVDQFSGKLTARVGLATNKPAEFIILKVSQDTRALEEEIAAAA